MAEVTVLLRHRILRLLATAAALAIFIGLAYGLTRPAPPRDVAFVGGPDSADGRCHGSVLWTGEVAYSACDWAYRERAVVEFDPEAAQARVLHWWTGDDGNIPVLELVRPCDGGQLFVVRETRHTTLIRRRGEEVRASRFASDWDVVTGAECRGDAVELFTTASDHYAIYHVAGDRPELRKVISAADMPGAIVGAWFAGDAWQVVVQDSKSQELLVGQLASELARSGAPPLTRPACIIGEPGGWLGTSNPLGCYGGVVVERAGEALRVTRLERSPYDLVVQAGATPGFGINTAKADANAVRLRGPGALEIDLYRRDGVFLAQRGAGPAVTIAKASRSSLDTATRALPLSGDRVAIWGGLGERVLILGPDLQRLDAPGPVTRIVRPFHHFRASAKSTFDLLCFYALLLAAPAWLLARLTLARRAPRGLITAAGLFVMLCLLGAWAYVRVLTWI